MSNVIQIKRGGGENKPDGKLAPYELGLNTDSKILYFGGPMKPTEEGMKYGDAIGVCVEKAMGAHSIVDNDGTPKSVGSDTNPIYLSNGEFIRCGSDTTISGTTEYAKSLSPGRYIQADLGKNEKTFFDGKEDITIGTTGVLPLTKGGTGANSETAFKSLLLNMIYPVGSIYISTTNTSPATFLGGSWEQIQDTFLLAAGSVYKAGQSGGQEKQTFTHEHTLEEAYAQIHHNNGSIWGHEKTTEQWQDNLKITVSGTTASSTSSSGIAIGGTTDKTEVEISNMPPYLTVYMWKRTK